MKKAITLISLCLFSFSVAFAEGYQVNLQSTKQAAMGHVGASMKLGAESMHFNPAGLVFMDNTIDLSAGVSSVFSRFEYSNGAYSHKSDNDPSTPLYFYGGFKIYDFLAAGVSVTNPYGSAMNWGVNWAGSGLIQEITLKSFSIQPTLSWKIMDRLSVGAGMMIMFGDFSLSRALIPAGGLEGLRVIGSPQVNAVLDNYTDIAAASTTLSGNSGVKMGFNVGAMFDINDQFTVGVSYRSKVDMKVNEGSAEMSYPNEAEIKGLIEMVNPYLPESEKIIIPPLDQGTFEAALPLPSNLNIGVTYKPNDRWLVSGEVQFVGWGAYEDLNVEFTQGAIKGYSINAVKNYKNTRIYRIGTQFAATDRFDLRFGAYLDESPVKDDFLNPETPSMDKLGITAGFSFRPLDAWSIDLALSYVTGFGRDGSYPYPTKANPSNTFGGHYEVKAFTPSIGLSYSF